MPLINRRPLLSVIYPEISVSLTSVEIRINSEIDSPSSAENEWLEDRFNRLNPMFGSSVIGFCDGEEVGVGVGDTLGAAGELDLTCQLSFPLLEVHLKLFDLWLFTSPLLEQLCPAFIGAATE